MLAIRMQRRDGSNGSQLRGVENGCRLSNPQFRFNFVGLQVSPRIDNGLLSAIARILLWRCSSISSQLNREVVQTLNSNESKIEMFGTLIEL
jgi:hypothetical protein